MLLCPYRKPIQPTTTRKLNQPKSIPLPGGDVDCPNVWSEPSVRVRWGEGQAAWPNGVNSWSEHLGHFKAGQPSLSLLAKSAAASPAFALKLK